MTRTVWRLALLAALSALVAAFAIACGGDGAATDADDDATAMSGAAALAEPANKAALAGLKGDIIADGSSTVYPITAAAAEEFRRYAKDVRGSVGIAGTGGGFKKFCAGETDISNASRPISTSEVTACADKKIEFIELPVAYDGLAVVVSPRNTFVSCLTTAELKKIWEPEAQGKITNWKQVRDSFPDRPLKLFGPGTDSGTFDFFTQAINGKEKASRGDFQASEDDNVLVQGVTGDEAALGYFGYAYYVENPGKLKLVGVDKGDGTCRTPSVANIADQTYQPLARPLLIYVKKTATTRPEVMAVLTVMLSKSFTPAIQTAEVGYVPLSDKLYEAATKRLTGGTVGTLWPKGTEIGATLDRYLQ